MSTASPSERVAMGRLLWVGPLAVIASVIANGIVRVIAVPLLNIPTEFQPLSWGQFIFLTVVGTGLGAVVFAVVARFAKRPIRTFRIISVVALLLSWLPDFGLLAAGDRAPYPGTSLSSVGVLMFMHVVAAVVSVGLLTTLTQEKG